MSSVNTHHSAPLSAQALERFAREVAKYPDDQKQSAVMACLSIAQQEQGYVSAESERVIAELLGMAPMAVRLQAHQSAEGPWMRSVNQRYLPV